MKRKLILLLLMVSFSTLLSSQVKISGFVKDTETGEVLIGAHVVDINSHSASVTDLNGYFSLICSNNATLVCSYVGYKEFQSSYRFSGDSIILFWLMPGSELEEVTVKATKRATSNISTLSNKEINLLPSLSGKPDVLKTAQFLPGIQGQSEASSLLLVRGGDPGQNMYLLDNTPLIYVNHLGGFMSVFNPDMINDVSIYKAGFPAEYGGKLSSVVNITQKHGDNKQFKGSYSLGITDVSLSTEGPLSKNVTYILTGRKTLFDILLYGASKLSEGGDYTMRYGFHDINGKVVWTPDEKNLIQLNIYQGDDYINIKSKSINPEDPISTNKNIWGNWLMAAKWSKIVSPAVYASNSLSYTHYRLKNNQTINGTGFDFENQYLSSVQNTSFKSDWQYKAMSVWAMKFGFHSSWLMHQPQDHTLNTGGQQIEAPIHHSLENALFVDNAIKLFKYSEFIVGIRGVNYLTSGFADISIEPRLNLQLGINANQRFNISYTKMSQNSHLLFTTGSFMSNETWVPATDRIRPAISHQFSVGWSGEFLGEMFQTEIEAYYKTMKNLATYKSGYNNLRDIEDWESRLETGGEGESYGIEFLLKKTMGDWTGMLSYTYSQTNRTFQNLNDGKPYWYEYHRPHAFSIAVNKKLTEKMSLSMAWVYQTGLPYTPVIGRQNTPAIDLQGQEEQFYYEAFIYGERNSGKLADYHRLDVSIQYETLTKKHGNKAIWTFAIYNAYNRHNPNYYYYNSNNSGEIHHPEMGDPFKPLSIYQMSLFPILPSISYKVYFGGNQHKNSDKAINESTKQKFKNWLYHEN